MKTTNYKEPSTEFISVVVFIITTIALILDALNL